MRIVANEGCNFKMKLCKRAKKVPALARTFTSVAPHMIAITWLQLYNEMYSHYCLDRRILIYNIHTLLY